MSVSVLFSPYVCLLIPLTVCSFCSMSICNVGCFPFGFEGATMVLMAPVPGNCLPFTFDLVNSHGVWYKRITRGVDGKMLHLIRFLYKSEKYAKIRN